jgi:hypothetical protein
VTTPPPQPPPGPPSGAAPGTPGSPAGLPGSPAGPLPPAPPPPRPPLGPPPGQVPKPPAAPARPGRLRGIVPLAVAAVAVLFALASLVVAARALSVANDAKDALAGGTATTAPANGGGEVTEPAPRESQSEAPPPVDPNSSDPPELNEQTNYEVDTEKESLTLLATTNSDMALDVDEPRAYPGGQGGDLILNADYNGQRYFLLGDGVSGSSEGAPAMSPKECVEVIRKAPLPGEARVPAKQGDVICLFTSFAAAQNSGDEWRVARVTITGQRSDGAVTVEVTAWNIPR